MSAQIKLVRRMDNTSDISDVSLWDFEDGVGLARDGWRPAVGSEEGVPVQETLALMVEGDDHDDLAEKLQAIDDKVEEIRWWLGDESERYGVWLRVQLPNETYGRQALITDLLGQPGPLFSPPVSPGDFLREYSLGLTRMPFWESVTAFAPSFNHGYCYGSLKALDGTTVGNVPGRIWSTTFWDFTGAVYEAWLGFRSDRFGDQTKFVPLWECEDGTLANSTTATSDGTASGSSKAQCTFGTATMLPRVTLAVEDVTTDYDEQRGYHDVLLRAKVGSSTTCHVRLGVSGYVSSSDWFYYDPVLVDSTSWFLYQLGSIRIPPVRSRGSHAAYVRGTAARIEASRASGSGNLDMDCLIMIPKAEGALWVSGLDEPSYVRMTPDGNVDGWAQGGSSPTNALQVNPYKYAMPIGECSAVVAGQRETQHTLTDEIAVIFDGYSRWRTLRGAGLDV